MAQQPDRPSALHPGFVGAWTPIPHSPLYLVALLLVACVAILMPLAYVAIVAAAGYGVYEYALWAWNQVQQPTSSGRLGPMSILFLVAPALAGVVAVIFLLKPLIAPGARAPDPVRLPIAHEPRLHAFVRQICETIGAPVPTWIEVTTDVNASASFTRGMWSVLGPSDLTLTIGLPLVRGLTTDQLAGVSPTSSATSRSGSACARITSRCGSIRGSRGVSMAATRSTVPWCHSPPGLITT